MKSSINLATEPFVNYRGWLLTTSILVVAAVGLTVWLGIAGVQVWQERSLARERLRQLETRRAELAATQQRLEAELRTPATYEQLERARFLNQLIQRKSLSWTRLFFDLQERLPARVRILSLAPSVREDGRLQVELRVGGQAASDIIEFLQGLESGQKFQEIVLRSQNRAGGDSPDPITAELSAVYVEEQAR